MKSTIIIVAAALLGFGLMFFQPEDPEHPSTRPHRVNERFSASANG